MRNKRGLSAVVTTILIIVLVLVVVSIVGMVVLNLANKTSRQISTDLYTAGITLSYARMDFETGIASVKVERGSGGGEIVALKFIFEDDRTSEAYDFAVVGFNELEGRTFDIDLGTETSTLVISKLEEVYVVPKIVLESGEEEYGTPSEPISLKLSSGSGSGSNFNPNPDCYLPSDCGTDHDIVELGSCDLSGVAVMPRYEYSCTSGICGVDVVMTSEVCPVDCYEGICVDARLPCTIGTVVEDCGPDGLVGDLSCSDDFTISQNYRTYSCVDLLCNSLLTPQLTSCPGEEVCLEGECFVPIECTTHDECTEPGEICIDGFCDLEPLVNSGTVLSIWPFGIGEYFDSADLEAPETEDLVGYYILFPDNPYQTTCLRIIEHILPEAPGASPYVRLNVTVSGVAVGSQFQIWETSENCE